LLFVAPGLAIIGVDVSVAISSTVAKCLVSSGYSFIILRAWYCGSGTFDSVTSSLTSYNNLRDAGMPHIGFYLFPCVGGNCPSASAQVSGMASRLTSAGLTPDSVWLDIETPQAGQECYWQGTTASKQAFYTELVSTASNTWGSKLGVYSSYSEWQSCFGSQSWKNPSGTDGQLPMWYARYGGGQSFSDFTSFGSWQTPYAKQYSGDATVCGIDVDIDYAPVWDWSGNSSTGDITPAASPNAGPATQPVNPCKDPTGLTGYCTDQPTCTGVGGMLFASSAGATGCEAFDSSIKCCSGGGGNAPQVALVSCSYATYSGKCMATTDCLAMRGQSRKSSAGAKGCEALPSAIQCCVETSSQLQDGYSSGGGSIMTGTSLGVIVGAAIGALVLLVVVIGVVVYCALRRRSTAAPISYANEAYQSPATITMTPESISKKGAAQFL